MPEPNPNLIVPVLINGAIFAALAVIVPAFLLSRFTRDIFGRSVLVIFLFVAAGATVYNYYKPDRSLYERATANIRSHLGEEGFEEAWAQGKAMTFEQAVTYALGVTG